MAYQINDASKEHAAKCPFKFECLENENWRTCSIEESFRGGLGIKNKCTEKFCNYSLYFGVSRLFCICPVRCEIYHTYRK